METPCFLRPGSAGGLTLAILGLRIDLPIYKNMAMLHPSSPELLRNGEQATATPAVRATSSYDSAIHAGPVCPSLFGVDKAQRTRGGWGRDSALFLGHHPCPSLLLLQRVSLWASSETQVWHDL